MPERVPTIAASYANCRVTPGEPPRGARVYFLEIVGPADVTARYPLSNRPFRIGRGAGNDLIVLDDAASTSHCRVWAEEDGPRIADLGSRNGTWVNDARITGVARLTERDAVLVGADVRMRVREAAEVEGAVAQVEDLDLGLRHQIHADRFSISGAPSADVVVPGANATLLIERDGETWLGQGEEVTQLMIDQPFVVAGRRFCLRRPLLEAGVTRDLLLPHELTPARYPYDVVVHIAPAQGAQATFKDTIRGKSHTVTAENPSLLLYILVKRQLAEGSAVPHADRGWVADDEVAVGIWGRVEATRQAANLNVLVWRVRKELESAGFDPWCLEKRKKHMRLRVDSVLVR